jgi:hypothetical protein
MLEEPEGLHAETIRAFAETSKFARIPKYPKFQEATDTPSPL